MIKTVYSSNSNKMLRFANGQRSLVAAVVIFCIVAAVYYGRYMMLPRPYNPEPEPEPAPEPDVADTTDSFSSAPPLQDAYCDPQSIPPDTLIVVKTGANEIYDKLPTQLLTSLRCYDDNKLLFFSDLEQTLGPYTIHDALDNVTESVQKDNPQFDYYRLVQEYSRNGQDLGALPEETGQAAWNLDKYKFLHMLEKTWKLRPNHKWYVFIEADTYLVQSNLRLWLKRLNSSKSLYFGSPTTINGDSFSHGGSGFILSGVALSRFAHGDEGIAARYDEEVSREQFGDYMLTKVLQDKGVKFRYAWPMLQAEKPSTIPFGPGPDSGTRHWCQPIVTMHHITPNEATQIWAFEQQRHKTQTPVLLKDLYQGMVASEIRAEREDWYNLSDDLMYRAPGINGDRQKAEVALTPAEREAYLSFEHCRRACEEYDRCLQFVYFDQTCGFSFSYRLGERRLPDKEGKAYKSGWVIAKTAADGADNTCKSPKWVA